MKESTIGSDIYLHYPNDVLFKEAKRLNGWEKEVQSILMKICKDKVFLDIGSNLGYHTIPVARVSREVHSFEPNSKMFDLLQKNIKLNNLTNVIGYPTALGKEELFFYSPDSDPLINKGMLPLSIINKGNLTKTRRLDDFEINPDVIKIDVNGFEKFVIEGGLDTIKRCKPTIIFSAENHVYLQNGYRLKDVLSLLGHYYLTFVLESNYYQCNLISVHSDKFTEFKKYQVGIFNDILEDTKVLDCYTSGIRQMISPKKTVMIRCNWGTPTELMNVWNKFLSGNESWELVDKDPDYFLILNFTNEYFDPKRSWIFLMEPNFTIYKQIFDEMNKDEIKKVSTCETEMRMCEWHLSKSHSQLKEERYSKTKEFSTVVSSLYLYPLHRKRVDFLRWIEQSVDIDIYGRDNSQGFKRYLHPLPPNQKEEGLTDYRYSLCCENTIERNHFTEKLVDAILCECLVFYYGCPNIFEFFPEGSIILIDLDDFEKSKKIIVDTISNDLWNKNLDKILEAKSLILDSYSLGPRIESLIN